MVKRRYFKKLHLDLLNPSAPFCDVYKACNEGPEAQALLEDGWTEITGDEYCNAHEDFE